MKDDKAIDIMKLYKKDMSRHKPKQRLSHKELANLKRQENHIQLVGVMLPYALQVVNAYQFLVNSADFDYPDLVQEASIATIQAVNRWDPDKGAALTTVVKFAIKGRLRRLAGHFSDYANISLDWLQESAENGEIALQTVQNILTDESQNPEKLCQYLQLVSFLDVHANSLPDRQREAVRLFCGLDDGMPQTLTEIALEMGISPARVRQLLDRGLKILNL